MMFLFHSRPYKTLSRKVRASVRLSTPSCMAGTSELNQLLKESVMQNYFSNLILNNFHDFNQLIGCTIFVILIQQLLVCPNSEAS